MSLLDAIKQDEEELKKLEAGDDATEAEGPVEVVEEAPVEVKEEPKTEDPKVEESKPEEPDASAYARMRREKAAAEARARDLEARLEALEKAKQPSADETVQHVQHVQHEVEIPPEMVEEYKINAAKKHLHDLEIEFLNQSKVDDYDDVVAGYIGAVANSIALLEPSLSPSQLKSRVEMQILSEARGYFLGGLNPAEEMYSRAKSMGFKPAPKEEEPKEEPKKASMATVATVKHKSTGMGGAGGSSANKNAVQAALDMSLGEISRLSPSELKKLEAQFQN